MRVLSQLPDTMVVPSGEKATDVMRLLWAFVFLLTKVRDAASTGEKALVSSSRGRGSISKSLTPDFDRAIIGTGNDLSPVVVELDGADDIAVGVRLLALELQCGCDG